MSNHARNTARRQTMQRAFCTALVASAALAGPALAAPDVEADAGDRICPALVDAHGDLRACRIGLENAWFEQRPPGFAGGPNWQTFRTLPGWAINGDVHMITVTRHHKYGLGLGLAPGRVVSQTVEAPRPWAGASTPLPTYHLTASVTALDKNPGGTLTVRIIGIMDDGSERVVASQDISPQRDDWGVYDLRGNANDFPAKVRIELSRPMTGSDHIYVDGVSLFQTFTGY